MSRRFFFNLGPMPWEQEAPTQPEVAPKFVTEGRAVRTSREAAGGWIGHREALRRLGINARTAEKFMARTAPEDAPWIDIGTGTQHHYRWKADALDAWLQRVAGGRGGAEKPAMHDPQRRPKRRQRQRATKENAGSARSKLGQSGSLVRLVVDNSDAS